MLASPDLNVSSYETVALNLFSAAGQFEKHTSCLSSSGMDSLRLDVKLNLSFSIECYNQRVIEY